MGELNHAMVDTETWGLAPGSAPRSIGAVMFDPLTGKLGAEFYVNIDRESCLDIGLHTEPGTEKFWRDQSTTAQAALISDQRHIIEAITMFFDWWDKHRAIYIWSQGANFDEVHLSAIARVLMIDVPWKFWNVRCSRTVLALGNRRPDRSKGTHHHALDDAKAQAVAVSAVLRQWPGVYVT